MKPIPIKDMIGDVVTRSTKGERMHYGRTIINFASGRLLVLIDQPGCFPFVQAYDPR